MKENNSTTHSVKWNAINSMISQVTTIITGVVLMRILDPSAFGLIGMITVFTGFLNVLKDSGLGSSLIYQSDLKKIDKDTVFWFNISVGFILFLGLFIFSNLIASYYDEPLLSSLTKVFSFTFILSALSQIHHVLFKKSLDFKKIFKVEVVGLVSSATLAISAAFLGFGVWSLLVLHVSRTLIISINTWLFSNYRPAFSFSSNVLKKHFQYSFPVLGTKSFNYWTRNADNFFIGSFLGSTPLGYYSRAYFFVTMPVQKISSIIGKTLFPSLSLLKDNNEKAIVLYLKSMRMTAFVTFPLLGGLIILAKPFVLVAFGTQWLPIITTLKILCILSLLQSVIVLTNSIYFAKGATKLNFKLSILSGISNIIGFYIGSQYSIEMVATLLLSVYLLFMIPKLYYGCRLMDLNISKVIKNLSFIFMINLLAMLVCFVFVWCVNAYLSVIYLLLLGTLLYVATFISLNILFNRDILDEFLFSLKKVMNK